MVETSDLEKLQIPLSTWCVLGMPSKMIQASCSEALGPVHITSSLQDLTFKKAHFHPFLPYQWLNPAERQLLMTCFCGFKSVQRSALDPGRLVSLRRFPCKRRARVPSTIFNPGEHQPRCVKSVETQMIARLIPRAYNIHTNQLNP